MKTTVVARHNINVEWIKKYPTFARFTIPFLMVFIFVVALFVTVREVALETLPAFWRAFKAETNLLWRIMRYGIEKE